MLYFEVQNFSSTNSKQILDRKNEASKKRLKEFHSCKYWTATRIKTKFEGKGMGKMNKTR